MPQESSKNTLQSNPGNAATDFEGWPDWNSKAGVGQPSPGEKADRFTFENIYNSSRDGSHELEAQRLAENRAAGEPRTPAEVTDADHKRDRSSSEE